MSSHSRHNNMGRLWLDAMVRVTVAVVGAVVMAGCAAGQSDRILELRAQNDQLTQQLNEAGHCLVEQQAALDIQAQQIETLQVFGSARLEKLVYPTRLVIDRLSGGYDEDGQPGDDGVRVYLKPVDEVGDTLKCAGAITVELFDLGNPDGQHGVGRVELDVDQVGAAWYGKLWTVHYTVQCPWSGPAGPGHREITVRATFTDYLTGRTLRAQRVCTVALPGGKASVGGHVGPVEGAGGQGGASPD